MFILENLNPGVQAAAAMRDFVNPIGATGVKAITGWAGISNPTGTLLNLVIRGRGPLRR